MDLKQSTARVRVFSFLGVNITSLSVTISKNGAAFGALSGAGLANITGNFYKVTLDATDTNTLGDLAYKFSDTVLGVIAPNDGDVDQVLSEITPLNGTTALTEDYAADGAGVNLAQAIYEIMAYLEERSISGTTLTCKKRNGSTTAMTFTLNDATTPTGITRVT